MQVGSNKYEGIKSLVYRLDDGKCHICGKKVSYHNAVLDHIIPLAIAGRDHSIASSDYWNLRIAHRNCNAKRSNGRIPGQIRLSIKEEYIMQDCPECNSTDLVKAGKTWKARQRVQRWRCKKCGLIFTERPEERANK